MMSYTDETMRFDVGDSEERLVSEMLTHVYNVLADKGYNPINQIVGYLLSEDPAYIPRTDDARSMIRKFERDEIMEVLVKDFLESHGTEVE